MAPSNKKKFNPAKTFPICAASHAHNTCRNWSILTTQSYQIAASLSPHDFAWLHNLSSSTPLCLITAGGRGSGNLPATTPSEHQDASTEEVHTTCQPRHHGEPGSWGGRADAAHVVPALAPRGATGQGLPPGTSFSLPVLPHWRDSYWIELGRVNTAVSNLCWLKVVIC
jgi:hypothetical protein